MTARASRRQRRGVSVVAGAAAGSGGCWAGQEAQPAGPHQPSATGGVCLVAKKKANQKLQLPGFLPMPEKKRVCKRGKGSAGRSRGEAAFRPRIKGSRSIDLLSSLAKETPIGAGGRLGKVPTF